MNYYITAEDYKELQKTNADLLAMLERVTAFLNDPNGDEFGANALDSDIRALIATIKGEYILLVEKKNHLHVHAIFDSMQRAERHLAETIPMCCARGYFMDKTLQPDDFEIIEGKYGSRK